MREHILTLVYASNRTNKPVGKIVEIDSVIYLIKSCKNKHFLRQPPAIAYDCSIIDLATSYHVQYLIVTNSESKDKYEISLAAFKEKSFKVNRGFGPQLACPLENWASTYTENKIRAAQRAIEIQTIVEEAVFFQPDLQPSLWDAGKVLRNWITPETFELACLIS
jgi:hypothetical protein